MMKNIIITLVLFFQYGFTYDNFYYLNNEKIYLSLYNTLLRSNPNIDYYLNEKAVLIGISNKLLVKCQTEGCLDNYMEDMNLTIVKELSKGLYLVKVTDKLETLKIANELSRKENIQYAHPDFIKKRLLR